MKHDKLSLLCDLAPFADLGTMAPQVVENGRGLVCRFVRESKEVEIVFHPDGSIFERANDYERSHANLSALLASATFANLGRWADAQRVLLHDRVTNETIQLSGLISEDHRSGGVDLLSDLLYEKTTPSLKQPRVLVTLIDGPAGIGKTSIIRSLSYNRACCYRTSHLPLILHVESRGRVLQNISDLMAFSLQTLRLSVTYDQVPTLVRNGLITLAIDGFDELGDPNGYELAWAQVNDLIVASRGSGSIVLAGRETFLTQKRMELALSAIDKKYDQVKTFTLEPIKSIVARRWLINKGWTEAQIDAEAAKPLFEDRSYALRPFFLAELAREGVAAKIYDGDIEDLLPFLVEAMTCREAAKFGRDIEVLTSASDRETYVHRLMEEVARDLAENQSDAISNDSLIWLAEVVAYNIVPSEISGMLKNRAGVIAFLTEDDRRGYKRFVHEQILNFFLAHVTVRSILNGELPKYVRRNILGPEFLESFCSVFREFYQKSAGEFISIIEKKICDAGGQDRAIRNLGALLIAACCVSSPKYTPKLENIALEEIFLIESTSKISLKNTSIAQMYARSADLRLLDFSDDCYVYSLIADEGTIFPQAFPLPNIINTAQKTLSSPEDKISWILSKTYDTDDVDLSDFYRKMKELDLFNLLARVARYKPFWLKDGDERASRRILDDPSWETLKPILFKHDFLVERRDVPASGRPGTFYHLKNRDQLLTPENLPTALFEDLMDEADRMESARSPHTFF